jgi:hypothetical protein
MGTKRSKVSMLFSPAIEAAHVHATFRDQPTSSASWIFKLHKSHVRWLTTSSLYAT